jgi:BlaI family transcriptional regulator, penicillinase repressor
LVRQKSVKLSRFEFGLMDVLWKLGRASIREIHEELPEKKRPAYTTVQTMVNRLEAKGAVRRVRKISNAHIYEAVITRKAAYRRLIDDVLDLFGGSVQPLMAELFEAGKLTLEDVHALETAVLNAKKRKPSGE